MKCNTILKKLLVQLFVALSVILCINFSNASKCYAYTQSQYLKILNENINLLPNYTKNCMNWFINNLIYTKDWFVFDENNDLIVISPTYSSNVGYEYDIYYINLNGYKFSASDNGSYPRINFNGTVRVHRFDFYTKNGSTYTQIANSTYNTNNINLNRNNSISWNDTVIVAEQFMQNTSYTGTTGYTYYFKKLFSADIEFTKRVNNHIDYQQTWQWLGTLNDFDKDKANFIMVDVTGGTYDTNYTIASTYDGNIKIGNDGHVSTLTRLLYTDHDYDLYFIYEGQDTQQYRYNFTAFNESGEAYPGYTTQTGVNDLINYQKSGDQQVIQAIESGNKEIISAIESGNNEIVGSINEILDPTVSGDIISNINIIPEISFSGDTFFTMIFNNIYSLFTSGDEVVTLHIPITKTDQAGNISEYYDVPSNFMKVRETSILRIGLSLMWWWVIGYPFIKWLYSLVFKLNQGSIGEAVDELTTTKGLF